MSADTPGLGHNSVPEAAKAQLKSFVERVERLEEEKKGAADDIRDIYIEVKKAGFDPKVVRRVIRERKKDAAERAEEEAMFDLYWHTLGLS
jgi:uncharacterized protein (UPF0335 family)